MRNALLNSLTPDVWSAWEPHFERVSLGYREELLHPGEPVRYLWFPESGIQSQVVETLDGESVEVAVVGPEGMVGLPAVFGVPYSNNRTIAQTDSDVWRVSVDEFRRNLHADHPLLRRLERYAAAVMGSLAQIAACNRLHSAEERLCRWLLIVHDRAGRNRIPMTHEFLSLMLGTRRATVSDVANSLQDRGLIRYEPGAIEFVNVPAIEKAACECYGVIRWMFEQSARGPNTIQGVSR